MAEIPTEFKNLNEITAATGISEAAKFYAIDGSDKAVTLPVLREGMFGRVRPPTEATGLLGSMIAKAKMETVRILMGGTSIAAFDNSNNQVFANHLRAVFGDAMVSVEEMGVLGGDYTTAYNGWKHQPYGGPRYWRLRGESTSTALTFTRYFSELTIEASTETNGGRCTVEIDGVTVGTVECLGAQSYSVKTEFEVDLGLHTVTIRQPASGYIYLERLRFGRGLPGVEIIDGTLGGLNLAAAFTVHAGSGSGTVPGIAIEEGVGVASYFGRADVDLVIWSGPVNDTSSGIELFKSRLDAAIAVAKDAGCSVALVAEMGGHYVMPAFGYHASYLAMYEYMLRVGLENQHVFTVDWHGETFDGDIETYGPKFYEITGLNVAAGTYSGDFIHPKAEAQQIAVGIWCAMTGITPPEFYKASEIDRSLRTAAQAPGDLISFSENGVAHRARIHREAAQVHGTLAFITTVPMVESDTVTDLVTVNAAISASVTEDDYGKYVEYTTDTAAGALSGILVGETVTVTARVANGGQTRVSIKQNVGLHYFDGVLLGRTAVDAPLPIWVTFEYLVTGANAGFFLTGRFYHFSVTRTGGQPVKTTRSRADYRGVGPDALLVGDPAYNPKYLGQGYVEEVGAALLQKTLVGGCWKWNTTSSAFDYCGLYRTIDRAGVGYKHAMVAGTTASAASDILGGFGETASGSPVTYGFAAVAIGVAKKITLCMTVPAVATGVKVYFINGGTNAKRYLTATGTWSDVNQLTLSSGLLSIMTGETIALTMDVPTTEVGTLGATPDLRVEMSYVASGVYGTITMANGQSAIV